MDFITARACAVRVVALVLALSPSATRADTVFTNLNTVASGIGPIIGGAGSSLPESVAESFTPAANYTLSGAEAWLDGVGFGGTVDFAIYSSATGIPGSLLVTIGAANVPSGALMIFTENSPSTAVKLLSGVQYWLVLTPGTSSTRVVWDGDGLSSTPFAFTLDTNGITGWTLQGSNTAQFQINGTPVISSVPEPTNWRLLFAGLGTVAIYLQRRARWR